VQGELREVLGTQGDHARVVGPRRDLAEVDLVAAHEELDAEQARAAQGAGHLRGDLLAAARSAAGAHGLRLPGFAVVAVFLAVADGLAEATPPMWRTVSRVIS
jgi:hypothetical protein